MNARWEISKRIIWETSELLLTAKTIAFGDDTSQVFDFFLLILKLFYIFFYMHEYFIIKHLSIQATTQ